MAIRNIHSMQQRFFTTHCCAENMSFLSTCLTTFNTKIVIFFEALRTNGMCQSQKSIILQQYAIFCPKRVVSFDSYM